MPHLIIEHSTDLNQIPGFSARAVVEAGAQALESIGVYALPAVKVRIHPVDVWQVEQPSSGGAFIAVQLRIRPDHDDDVRLRTSQALTDAMAAALPEGTHAAITTEIVEFDDRTYTKRQV